MNNKTRTQRNSIYTFVASQIQRGDVRDFLAKHDPFRLPTTRVRELFGSLVLGFQGLVPSEVPSHPELRLLLRRLQAIWPWGAYFLDLNQPFGEAEGVNKFPLLALGLCVSDIRILKTKSTTCYVAGSCLTQYIGECHAAVDRLGRRAGLPPGIIAARHLAVNAQFQHIGGGDSPGAKPNT